MSEELKNIFAEIFNEATGNYPEKISQLPPSGSYKKYYRIFGEDNTLIGVYNNDEKENTAFVEFSKHFLSKNLPVSQIYKYVPDKSVYLMDDFGDKSLFTFLNENRKGKDFPEKVIPFYKKAIRLLPEFQIKAREDFNFHYCYPREKFDKQSLMWDLNYFKYYFLKLAKVPFNEQKLEDDFNTFVNFLLQEKQDYFMYRDYQSRNIMVMNDDLFFIDYQGGRKGALQYDIASLIFDSKANIPNDLKEEFLEFYITALGEYHKVNKQNFVKYYYGYVLIRIMQAMGAYGFRGFYERKEHFLKSIPFALKNLEWLLSNSKFTVDIPELTKAFEFLIESKELKKIGEDELDKNILTIEINSFSYKSEIPVDYSGHGGGFVFDCRSIHNPGKYEEYKFLNGKDKPVMDFLKTKSEAGKFLEDVYSIVDSSVEKYLSKKFNHLMISFGCTGGQHRSVYCAERLAEHLMNKYDVQVKLNHIELNKNV